MYDEPLTKKDLQDTFDKLTRQWTDQEIIMDLVLKDRHHDADLYDKFLAVGYKGLQGGNVVCRDTDRMANEYARVCEINLEYNRLAPDVHYLHNITEAEFKDQAKELDQHAAF